MARPGVAAVVSVTSDKCYENQGLDRGYVETDPMGGFDPYSASKGCAELVTSSYRRSFFEKAGIGLASARAGNVFGGGRLRGFLGAKGLDDLSHLQNLDCFLPAERAHFRAAVLHVFNQPLFG